MYKGIEHLNKEGEYCHGALAMRTQYALEVRLFEQKKDKLNDMLYIGLSRAHVMSHHKGLLSILAKTNSPINQDTFILPHDVRNLARKCTEELWQKHLDETKSMKMWKIENPEMVFFYQDHALLDLNVQKQDDTPFSIGIQTTWQHSIMFKFGHGNLLALDATFSTSHTTVGCVKHISHHYYSIHATFYIDYSFAPML